MSLRKAVDEKCKDCIYDPSFPELGVSKYASVAANHAHCGT